MLCQKLSHCVPTYPNPSERLCPWPQTARGHLVSPHAPGYTCSCWLGCLMPRGATYCDKETQKWESAEGSCAARPHGAGRRGDTLEGHRAA